MRRVLVVICACLLLLGGCASKPVRHLASEASLIKPGVSTRNDVLRYLGEPNGHRTVSPGVEEYVYYQNRKGLLGKTPVIGSWVGGEGYEMIVITLKNNVVTSCEYRAFNEADRDWMKDFTWEDVK